MTASDQSGQPGQPGQAEQAEGWVWLARIGHPQGRKGEVFAEILTDFPEKFAERKRLWLLRETPRSKLAKPSVGITTSSASPREVELSAHWPHKNGVVMHFAGVDSISAAETLTGLLVVLPLAERSPLGEDEVYIGDLIGCTLIDVAELEPVTVGEIQDVDRTAGPVALLVVRGGAGEILIPFAKSYLRRLDLEAKRVEMALPGGLTDLNALGKA